MTYNVFGGTLNPAQSKPYMRSKLAFTRNLLKCNSYFNKKSFFAATLQRVDAKRCVALALRFGCLIPTAE